MDADQEARFSERTPPNPPPLPPVTRSQKPSKIALKVAAAPPGWAFENSDPDAALASYWDPFTPPAGLYFFYGTLQDPGMLAEILGLESAPLFQQAHVIGYETKLWGQYPALVYGKPGNVVQGSAFEVPSEAAAARLAD